MADKVQKIREEVERLMCELIQEKEKGFGSDADDACILELQNILTYIDSLQEEKKVPKFKVGDTVRYKFNNICTKPRTIAEICGLSHYIDKDGHRMDMAYTDVNFELVEEPVSDDLEKEIERYFKNWYEPPYSEDRGNVDAVAKHFAAWQMQQLTKNVVLETEVLRDSDGDGVEIPYESWLTLANTEIPELPESLGLKEGDNVKVIIIKED